MTEGIQGEIGRCLWHSHHGTYLLGTGRFRKGGTTLAPKRPLVLGGQKGTRNLPPIRGQLCPWRKDRSLPREIDAHKEKIGMLIDHEKGTKGHEGRGEKRRSKEKPKDLTPDMKQTKREAKRVSRSKRENRVMLFGKKPQKGGKKDDSVTRRKGVNGGIAWK